MSAPKRSRKTDRMTLAKTNNKRYLTSNAVLLCLNLSLLFVTVAGNSDLLQHEGSWEEPDVNRRLGKSTKYSQISAIHQDPFHHIVTNEQQSELTDRWGKWKFWDGEEDARPQEDYVSSYPPYKDVPGEDFPDDAWQGDAVFVNHILNEAERLVSRAQEAIYTEYGHGQPLPPEGLVARHKMFKWDMIDLHGGQAAPDRKNGMKQGNGGWTTPESVDGLVRRLLHAMMVNDDFVIVMAGHSAAAGHGNHFHQSYMMQLHRVLDPIFSRLGMRLVTRNMAQGGLGTVHSALGAGSIYGEDIDLFIWDSGMTEQEPRFHDFLFRQVILSSKSKVPVIWGGDSQVLTMLHNEAGVDVGQFGTALDGIPEVHDENDLKNIPYAARCLKYSRDSQVLCNQVPWYCVTCWVDREDVPDPKALFPLLKESPGGQVSWHPGWRAHQLTGRLLAFTILDALQTAIQIFSEGTMGGPPLEDEIWHVGEYYESMRNKVRGLPVGTGPCYELGSLLPERICRTPLQGRTQHTPRMLPEHRSLSALIRSDSTGRKPMNQRKILDDRQHIALPCMNAPSDELDLWPIVSNRRYLSSRKSSTGEVNANNTSFSSHQRRLQQIEPGRGWEVNEEHAGYCDGSYYVICGREKENECPLNNHHDSRGYVSGNELSGWLVMDIPDVKQGLLMIKLFTWLDETNNRITENWTSVNNNRRQLRTRDLGSNATSVHNHDERLLKLANIPDSMKFEFAINGKVTTWTKDDFVKNKKDVARTVEVFTLLDDPKFPDGDVELAIRFLECGRKCTMGLTHVYWA